MSGFWPNGAQAAVSLSFDDGMESQLRLALPELDARRLRATFYLNPRGSEDDSRIAVPWRDALERWRGAHLAGHELGNHTIRHPCSLNIDVSSWAPNSLDWTLEQMRADITEAQRRLNAAFPQQAATSFAYPCYETTVGRGAGRVSYVPVVAGMCVAGRARSEVRGELANDPHYLDVFHLSSWPVERQSGAFMIGLVEQAAALGRWAILTILNFSAETPAFVLPETLTPVNPALVIANYPVDSSDDFHRFTLRPYEARAYRWGA